MIILPAIGWGFIGIAAQKAYPVVKGFIWGTRASMAYMQGKPIPKPDFKLADKAN